MPTVYTVKRRCITTFISGNAHFRRHLHACRTEGDSDSVILLGYNWVMRREIVSQLILTSLVLSGFFFECGINCIGYYETLVLAAVVKLHAVVFLLCCCSTKQAQSLLRICSSGITGVDGCCAGQWGWICRRCVCVCLQCWGFGSCMWHMTRISVSYSDQW
jgi:hypothetical protein